MKLIQTSSEFLDIAESNKTKFNRTLIFDDIIDSHKYSFAFSVNGEFNINDSEPQAGNGFCEKLR